MLSNEPTPTFERQVHATWSLSPPGRCLLPAACCGSMLLGSVQSGPVKLQNFILLPTFFLSGLIEVEKENKFRYRVVAQLLIVRTQHPPSRRGSQGLPVDAWAAYYARSLLHAGEARALKCDLLNENTPFCFLNVSIGPARCAGRSSSKSHQRDWKLSSARSHAGVTSKLER